MLDSVHRAGQASCTPLRNAYGTFMWTLWDFVSNWYWQRKGKSDVIRSIREQLAELFHHYHQALGRILAARARQTRSVGAGSTPGKNRLVAAARLALPRVGRVGPKLRRLKAVFRKTW
jgi:hypothetical protein